MGKLAEERSVAVAVGLSFIICFFIANLKVINIHILVLLSAYVERVSVSCMQNFFSMIQFFLIENGQTVLL